MAGTKPYIHELADFDPLTAFAAVRHMPYALLFDSADSRHPDSRYAFIVCEPVETIEAKDGIITVRNPEGETRHNGDPFAVLQERLNLYKAETLPGLPPFQGGAAGYFGYDLGRYIEKIPDTAQSDPGTPDMAVGIYDQVFAYDRQEKRAWIITHAKDADEARVKQKHLLRLFAQARPIPAYRQTDLPWESNFDAWEYKQQVRKIIEYIRAGDIFQANFSQRFDAELPEGFDPYAHYLRLRETNPAPFAAYMNFGDLILSSSSPERFLTVRGREVQTRPIKGTVPHVEEPAIDRLYRQKLLDSEKDRAENIMIVDLLRNDLSKSCTPESVKVAELCKLETFASVHHLVSTVTGELQEGKDALDLLRGCFPGGSITGAPKIRAMEIIEEVEPTRRGPYCGAAGYIGFDGVMDTNILIRTLVYQKGKVSLQAGSGIVADSSPDQEYQESFDKAAAIFRSFEEDLSLSLGDFSEEDYEDIYGEALAKIA